MCAAGVWAVEPILPPHVNHILVLKYTEKFSFFDGLTAPQR